MPADSSAIDAALLARLRGDAALTATLPDGVHFGFAPQGARTFGLVRLEGVVETPVFGDPGQRRGLEALTYEVAAVTRDTSQTPMLAAAARIDALLEDAPLTVAAFEVLSVVRVGRVRAPLPDAADPSLLWQRAGAQYRVLVAPADEEET
jgi:hypothetical protein